MTSVLTRLAKSALPRALPNSCRGGKVRGMGAKTNFHVEEWMGKREITEKTFEYTPGVSMGLIVAVGIVPVTLAVCIKSEMEKRDKQLGRERIYM